ncbi:MAG TPA: hypothetical protein VHA75_20230 [Rugosimonospora sp.]|nr:hypothetical protein [Rugosimonospora sp.]
MTTTAQLIQAHTEAGHPITETTAAAYLAQTARQDAAWQAALTGAPYDWTTTRPYADQYRCCGKGLARWAIEATVDGMPDRVLLCDACAIRAERHGEHLVQLLTVEQTTVLAARNAAGIGTN